MTAPGLRGRRAARLGRHTGISLALVAASVTIHASAGGAPPDSCLAVVALLALACLVTGVATYLAHRTRGGGSVVAAFAVGQLVMSGMLAAPGSDHNPVWSWLSALGHAVTSVLFAALVLGLGLFMAWLGELADRILPRCWRDDPTPTVLKPVAVVEALGVRVCRRAISGTGSRAPPVCL